MLYEGDILVLLYCIPPPYTGRDTYIFLVWTDMKQNVEQFIKSINNLHLRINFTAELSTDEITFLDLSLYRGERFAKEGILDIKTCIKPTNTNSTYIPHLPTHLEQAGVSSKENYLDTFEQTQMKLC